MRELDVLVVGAGPAGSAIALRLARRGLRVGLFERGRFEQARVGESLAPAAIPLLRDLGVWEAFRAVPHVRSYGVMSVWGDAEPQSHSYMSNMYGCGYHVERSAFDRMLADAAVAAGAELELETAVEWCEWTENAFDITARRRGSRLHVRSRVVIDATGRSAHVARRLGAQRVSFDRGVAVAARWEASEESHLLVEATPTGWFYSAPIVSGTLSLMLMTDADVWAETARSSGLSGRTFVPRSGPLDPSAGAYGLSTSPFEPSSHRSDSGTLRLNARASDLREQAFASRSQAAPDFGLARLAASLAEAPHTLARTRGAPPRSRVRVHCAQSQRLQHVRTQRREAGLYLAVGDAALAVDPIAGNGVVRALRSASAAADTVFELFESPHRAHALLAAYDAACDDQCTKYLVERAHYYAAERRFDSPYWRRRAHVAKLLSASGRALEVRT